MENKLFTYHDRYYLHKLLGFVCLFHYNLRLYYKFMYGTMLFNRDYITPLVHLSLSISSFIFHVPNYRYDSKIIIWKELQLHNIIFTSRSASIMLFSLFSDNNYYRLVIVAGHHLLADYVSNKYINDTKTTTRDIHYDDVYFSYYIKKYYAISQTFALMALLLNDNKVDNSDGLYENAFLIMYPIQLSAFLMTLVRKQIISNAYWHVFYGISLSFPYLINYINPVITNSYLIKIILGLTYTIMRLGFDVNKYIGMFGVVFTLKILNYY